MKNGMLPAHPVFYWLKYRFDWCFRASFADLWATSAHLRATFRVFRAGLSNFRATFHDFRATPQNEKKGMRRPHPFLNPLI
ncbi:hypothetical protein QUF84_26375 [Fictibacillus enclensis]|uniref:hypothetical protein n=1 Tax=Fictibacillus enclensis TaxID=1017270 RepID=UPI0025A30374|nr:hypothetical protein [Fictibacillus enclensis]MDM5340719.1 hypothetical protein [Fictibacillus enclensis]